MAVIAAAAFARASSSWLRCRMAGSAVRACSSRLLSQTLLCSNR